MNWRMLIWVLATWVVGRLMALAETFRGDIPMDVLLYGKWSQNLAAGSFPVGDQDWQYPPGAAILLLLLDGSPESMYRRFTIFALLADAILLAALVWTSARRGDTQLRGPWVWALAGLVIGPLLLQRYDVFPTLVAVIALILIARPYVSGATVGIGIIVKVWPALVLFGLPRRLFWRGILSAAATSLAVWGAMAYKWDNSADFIAQQRDRGLEIETVAALPLMVFKALGYDVPVRGQFGSWEITSSLGGTLALVLTITAIVAFALLAVARLTGRLETVPAGDVVLLAVLLFILTSKVNSPQYSIWLAGIASVALIDRRSRMLPVVGLLALMTLVANHVIWEQFDSFMTGNALMVGYQAIRIALLVAATAWAVVLVLVRPRSYAPAVEESVA